MSELTKRAIGPVGDRANGTGKSSGRGERAAFHLDCDCSGTLGERPSLDWVVDNVVRRAESCSPCPRYGEWRTAPYHGAILTDDRVRGEQCSGL